MPADLAARALVYQWSLWAITNVQPEGLTVMRHTFMLPEDQRDPKQIEPAKKACDRFVGELETTIRGEFLLGDRFTVADVNVGSVMNFVLRIGASQGAPKVNAWMERLRARPAYKKATGG
jgi:glutathione S-transferase